MFALTVPPAVELVLQPGDGVPQGLILLLLPFILLLPLFRRQLNVHRDCVLDGLCSGERNSQLFGHCELNNTTVQQGLDQPLSEHEGGFSFSLVVRRGRAADDDGGSTVATKGVLQNTGHLAVSVGDVDLVDTAGEPQGEKSTTWEVC